MVSRRSVREHLRRPLFRKLISLTLFCPDCGLRKRASPRKAAQSFFSYHPPSSVFWP